MTQHRDSLRKPKIKVDVEWCVKATAHRIRERIWPNGFEGGEQINPFDLQALLDDIERTGVT